MPVRGRAARYLPEVRESPRSWRCLNFGYQRHGARRRPLTITSRHTGNDNNPGTLAQPWALTSFIQGSANNNKMAGKRIGIIAGNYTITVGFP